MKRKAKTKETYTAPCPQCGQKNRRKQPARTAKEIKFTCSKCKTKYMVSVKKLKKLLERSKEPPSMKGEQRMLNRIVLIGRLTKDPELRYTPNGKAVATFVLAVDRPFRNQQGEREADFINIVVWGAQAESSAKYLAKGKLAAVDGRLQIRSFDGQDGQRRWVSEVVAENVRFLSPRDNTTADNNNNFSDDDIPF